MTNDICLAVRLFYFTAEKTMDVDNPAMSQILNAVVDLDGDDIDTVSVTLSNGASMDVGGGRGGKYKCHARTNGGFYDLIDPRIPYASHNPVPIMMNQEVNMFPACCIVSLDMVLMAIETFCLTGLMDSRLTWDDTLEYEPL